MLGQAADSGETVILRRSLFADPRIRFGALAVLACVALLAAWLAVQTYVLDRQQPLVLGSTVSASAGPLRPEAPIQVSVQGYGASLQGVRLMRTELASGVNRPAASAVDVRLDPVDAHTWRLVAPDGGSALKPDGDYRLVVDALALEPSLPLAHQHTVQQQYTFTTAASPRPVLPPDVQHPKWGQPVALTWSAPMNSLTVSTQPSAPIRAWVDETDRTRTWLQLGDATGAGLADGQTYDVLVTAARGVDGLELQRPMGLKIAVPARPRFTNAPTSPVTLKDGDSLTLTSSQDLASAQVRAIGDDAPAITSTVSGKQVRVSLPAYVQGASFDVKVAAATTPDGAPLAQPLTVHVQTPAAFDAPTLAPDDGARSVQPSAHPAVVFAEPVADRATAEKALALSPATPGHWNWVSATRAEFVPDGRLQFFTNYTLTVHGGPTGPRAAAGGFLADDVSAAFHTISNKRIEVSLSRQQMSLVDDGKVVRTFNVATGVAAAPTPPGEYSVEYKMAQARFQGYNPDGSHYDIPDVHWVMPFFGDYTIHGAYWRARFGTPGSDGCVSLTDADAKVVFDWAEVGTPVSIHA